MTPEEAYALGRQHERADVVDFITHPPGRLPDDVRRSIAELRKAIEADAHSGSAKRLYEQG